MTSFRPALLSAALAVCAVTGAAAAPVAADELRAAIVAGTGAIGVADGAGGAASFMMPTALAIAGDGRLVVADTAAQRIRAVDAAGAVTTLAGGGAIGPSGMAVRGGYADGPALAARFDRPSGVAVERDGAVVVADTGNHCLRRIARGAVTTIAGLSRQPGTLDGSRAAARFASPRGLAIDADGSIYVADWGAGVRRVAPDGTVTTLDFGDVRVDRPTGVAIGRSGGAVALWIADAGGLVRAQLPTLRADRIEAFPSTEQATRGRYPVSSDVPLGVPEAIAAFDAVDVAYTDLRDSSARFLRAATAERFLGRTPPEDAPLAGGGPGFAPDAPQYDAPMGVAVARDGAVYVADTGNRRIVRVAPFDRGGPVTSADLGALRYPAGAYRIAVVGSSYTWWGGFFDDSIAGALAIDLAGVPGLRARPPAARSFQLRLAGEFDAIDTVLAAGAADLVVLLISPIDPYGLDLGGEPASWAPYVTRRLAASADALRRANVPFVVVVNPAAQTVSPLESAYLFQGELESPATDYDAERRALLDAIAGAGLPVLDLFPAFRAEIASAEHRPLFNTADPHYSPYGRAFVARAIAAELARLRPWDAPSAPGAGGPARS